MFSSQRCGSVVVSSFAWHARILGSMPGPDMLCFKFVVKNLTHHCRLGISRDCYSYGR